MLKLKKIISIIYNNKIYVLAAFIMAVLRAGSLYFYKDRAVRLGTVTIMIIAMIRVLVYTALFFLVFLGINHALKYKPIKEHMFDRGGDKKGLIWDYVILAVGWLPLLIIKYPGAMCWDTFTMLHEYRKNAFSEHQSVYYTWLIGKLVDAGETLGHPNWGLFSFAILHYILLIFAFGYSLNLLRKMHFTGKIRWAMIIFYLINPYLIDYVGVMIKDTAYAAFLMIVIECIIDIHIDAGEFANKKHKMFLLAFAIVNTYLIRKNGAYIVIASTLIFGYWCLKNKKVSKKPLIVMGAACLLSILVFNWLGNYFNAKEGSIKEALSLPFQQTARYVKYYGDEVTEEEKAAIDEVLDYELISEKYNPKISDSVKGTYRNDASKLPAYFKVWLRQFFKHPLCYIEATWEQNYYLFVPEIDNITLYQDTDTGYETGSVVYLPDYSMYEDIFDRIEGLQKVQKWIIQEFYLIHELPGIRLLGNISFWTYMLIIFSIIAFVHKMKLYTIFAPVYLSMLFVILGPVIQGHSRYMFPVIYVLPIIIMFSIWGILKKSLDGN